MGDKPKSKLVTIDCNSDRKLVPHRPPAKKNENCGISLMINGSLAVWEVPVRISPMLQACRTAALPRTWQPKAWAVGRSCSWISTNIRFPSSSRATAVFCCTLHESTWCLTYLSDMLPKRPSNLRPKPRYDLLPTLVPGTGYCKNWFFQTSSILKHFKTCCKPRCSDGKNVFFPACEPSWSKECGHHLVCKQLCTSKGLHQRIQTCSANS